MEGGVRSTPLGKVSVRSGESVSDISIRQQKDKTVNVSISQFAAETLTEAEMAAVLLFSRLTITGTLCNRKKIDAGLSADEIMALNDLPTSTQIVTKLTAVSKIHLVSEM